MSWTGTGTQQPRLLRFTGAVTDALDRLEDPDPLYLSTEQKKQALLELAALEERLTALRFQVQAAAGDVADQAGARHAGAVLAVEGHRNLAAAGREQRLAEALRSRWAATGAAWRAGSVNGDQASVIVEALDKLPTDLDPGMVAKAEGYLLGQAGRYGPRELRILGRRFWEVIDPAGAEEQERLALVAEEANARSATGLNL
jgi:hypothetical protein